MRRVLPCALALLLGTCAGSAPETTRAREAAVAKAPPPAREVPPCDPPEPPEGALEDGEPDEDEVPVESLEDAELEPHPLAGLDDGTLEAMLVEDLESLGPMSIGTSGAGALVNGVRMPEDDRWELVDRPNSWGTRETVDGLIRAIAKVHEEHPGTGPLHIGDLSRKTGGKLRPHVSHQSGRDVDLGFYYSTPCRWYTRATEHNLDLPRTWSLLRALFTETDVELILLDRRVQRLLRDHARASGEDPGWLAEVFDGRGPRRAVVRHARGHATHLHVRFFNPVAQETGRRLQPALVRHGLLKARGRFATHRAREGQTLAWMARRYGTTVRAIRRANGLATSMVRAGQVYRIPRGSAVVPAPAPVAVPPRRVPPPRAAPPPGGPVADTAPARQ